ncbi:FKBP-type peptidyl-prolyl cis-trans isomerase [Subtercola endophyticus]|uniref:FKBP-type peptidyl-prolyl cis-trans isomerase n=1 Tax=Subtercola endophyticus TaxID=2895559 RepID=UPI001E4BA7ED|nr:FKBP-type peptidyl-prolyl cis-trans isomerase [Subtercola endophyticus]UFS60071.1 FKBP-type peptidyl-prolyl cis-trans isomerase [Subtercola endophyticus]
MLVTIAASTVLLGALAGCSGSPAPSPSASAPCSLTAPGPASDAVKVSGDFDTHPTTTFTAPITTDITERTVVITGTGPVASNDSQATIDFTLYNGTTGAELYTTLKTGGVPIPVTVDESQFLPGLVKAVSCSPVGSRVVAVVPPGDAYGANGNASLGVAATDTLVFVVDVKDDGPVPSATPSATLDPNIPTSATGAPQAAPVGFPTVTLAADGKPTVAIPAGDPPTTFESAVLKKGDGATVASGDGVEVQYQGLIWRTGTVFDESWGKQPATFSVGTGQVIDGFSQALIGQTVGSQIIAIIPPAQGYGTPGLPAANINGTDTLVFVVDILATTPAS